MIPKKEEHKIEGLKLKYWNNIYYNDIAVKNNIKSVIVIKILTAILMLQTD